MRTIIRSHRAAILATGMAAALAASPALAQQQNPEAQAGQRLQQQMQQSEGQRSGQQGHSGQQGYSGEQGRSGQHGQMSRPEQATGTGQSGQPAQSGQAMQGSQDRPVFIVETDDGYYLVRPRAQQGLVREFRATGPSDERPQRSDVNLDEFGREMYMRGYHQGRMEAQQALMSVLQQADDASGQSQSGNQSSEGQPDQGQWRQGQMSQGQSSEGQPSQGRMSQSGTSQQTQGQSSGQSQSAQSAQNDGQMQDQRGQQADAVGYLLGEARTAVQNNNMVQAEERLNRLDEIVRDDREKLQQAIDEAARAVNAGDPQAVLDALDQAQNRLQGGQS